MEKGKLVFNEIKNGETNTRVISDKSDIPLSTSYRVMKRWQGRESVEQRRGASRPTKYSWSDTWRLEQLVHRGKLKSVENLRHNMIQRDSPAVSIETIRRELNKSEWGFQQDNDPKTQHSPHKWLFWQENVDVLDLPSYSPDLNPIENIWRTLKVTINQKEIRETEAMTKKAVSYRENINHGFLHNFISSLTRQIDACVTAEGGVTKYFLNSDLKFIHYTSLCNKNSIN